MKWCWLIGHRWVERKPHRMFDLNDWDCTRCGKHMKRGIFT